MKQTFSRPIPPYPDSRCDSSYFLAIFHAAILSYFLAIFLAVFP
jgi:hypothetical protein